MKRILSLVALVLATASAVLAGDWQSESLDPPDAARPGVYWHFMDGNQDRAHLNPGAETDQWLPVAWIKRQTFNRVVINGDR